MKKFKEMLEQHREKGRFHPVKPHNVQNIAAASPRPSSDSASVKLKEDLRKWFSKTDPAGDWKRINSKGEAIGPCAREPGEPKPKCMSKAKRAALSKKERAAAVRAKRKHDPNPERKGEPINVSNFGKGKISENMENLDEKNVPTSPEKWARAKAMAKSKFDVYPSAYANGWASKKYKEMGGGWKSVSEENTLLEKWSQKYKSSIDCNNPKGFSQKAHCAGKNEEVQLGEEQHKEIDTHTEVEDGSHQDKNDTKDLHNRIKAAAKKHGATITYQDRPSLRGSHTISARGSHDFHKEVKKISSDYEHLGVQHEINEGAVPAKEKTVMVRHKTSGKELVVTQQKAKELQKHDYHPVKEEIEQIDELSNDTLKSYLKNKKEVEGGGVGRQGSGYSYEKSEDGTRSAIRRIQARKNQIGKYGEVPKVPGYNKEEVEQTNEAVKDKFDIGEYDQEGDMAKSDLRSIMANAKRVHDMLEDSDNLPEWVQSKITLAEDYMSTVANYMTSEMNEEVELDEASDEARDKKIKSRVYAAKLGSKFRRDNKIRHQGLGINLDTAIGRKLMRGEPHDSVKAYASEEVDAAIGLVKPKTNVTAAAKTLAPATRVAEESSWSKSGKEATHRETGKKTYEYKEYDKEGKETGRREYRDEKGKSMGEAVVPFDKPYTTTKGVVTDKSGAKHGPMSRARDIARMAMKKQIEKMKQPVKESLEESRKMEIVREAMKVAKKKKETTVPDDKYQSDPILSSQITKT